MRLEAYFTPNKLILNMASAEVNGVPGCWPSVPGTKFVSPTQVILRVQIATTWYHGGYRHFTSIANHSSRQVAPSTPAIAVVGLCQVSWPDGVHSFSGWF